MCEMQTHGKTLLFGTVEEVRCAHKARRQESLPAVTNAVRKGFLTTPILAIQGSSAVLFVGIIAVLVGLALMFADKIPFLGRLPGDFVVRKKSFALYFPIVTCLLLSGVASIVLYLFRR